jgi:hypothetical protein
VDVRSVNCVRNNIEEIQRIEKQLMFK